MVKNNKRNSRRRFDSATRITTATTGRTTTASNAPRSTSPSAGANGLRLRGLTTNLRTTLIVVALAVVALVTAMIVTSGGSSPDPAVVAERLVRADSHRLQTAADDKVTVVEFLDFECEACGAAYPGVERLRADYQGKITYVVRHFPLPGHLNANNAAYAAQAAANQGSFEAMYKKLFESQASWGDQQVDHKATFEQYAGDLGLNMDQYRTDVAAQATADRVNADRDDGLALGVSGTPTFFINGAEYDGRYTYEALKAAVDTALAQ